MIDAFSFRLPSSPRRSGGSVIPFFQTVRAKRIYRFSVNFFRFPPFFEKGVLLKKPPLSHSSRLRQRREEEKDMCLGVTLVRLSERMFILGADGLGSTTRPWFSVSQKPSTPAPNGSAQF